MVSSSSAFDDDDDDDDVSLLLSKSVSSSSPSLFFFESATKRFLFRRPRFLRPRSKRVLARVERRTLRFEKVEDDDDENHGAERTAPPPTRTVKEDVVMFSREHYTTLCRLCIVKVFPTIDAEVSRSVFSQSARFEIQFKCGEKRTDFSPKICCERERRATPTTTPSEEENQDQHSEEVKANTTRNGRRNTS